MVVSVAVEESLARRPVKVENKVRTPPWRQVDADRIPGCAAKHPDMIVVGGKKRVLTLVVAQQARQVVGCIARVSAAVQEQGVESGRAADFLHDNA